MELLLYFSLFAGSLFLLVKASDWFVASAEEIGLSFGISPFIIGVTIVAFGTSLPELASSIAAVIDNDSEIVVGNVIGSNIANILIVLGLVAIIAKRVDMSSRIMDIDVPILLASAFLLWFSLRDQEISIIEAIIFLVGLVIFLVNSFQVSDDDKSDDAHPKAGWKAYVLLITGGVLVYFSATWTIDAVQKLSEIAGVSPEFIALSMIAFGTSLPEIVVSITAVRKGKTGIAVGNVLGSNIFNTFAVMSIPAFIGKLDIPDNILTYSLPFMMGVTILFAFVCVTNRMSRWEGMMFVLIYIYFMTDLFVNVA